MKKLIVIFGVFAVICVFLSHYTTRDDFYAHAGEIVGGSAHLGATYVVTSRDEKIVVYQGDRLVYKTDTSVKNLPKKDRRILENGIKAKGEQQLRQVLADYCS